MYQKVEARTWEICSQKNSTKQFPSSRTMRLACTCSTEYLLRFRKKTSMLKRSYTPLSPLLLCVLACALARFASTSPQTTGCPACVPHLGRRCRLGVSLAILSRILLSLAAIHVCGAHQAAQPAGCIQARQQRHMARLQSLEHSPTTEWLTEGCVAAGSACHLSLPWRNVEGWFCTPGRSPAMYSDSFMYTST